MLQVLIGLLFVCWATTAVPASADVQSSAPPDSASMAHSQRDLDGSGYACDNPPSGIVDLSALARVRNPVLPPPSAPADEVVIRLWYPSFMASKFSSSPRFVEITGEGKVTAVEAGKTKDTRVTGLFTMPPSEVAELLNALYRIAFWQLADTYASTAPEVSIGNGRLITSLTVRTHEAPTHLQVSIDTFRKSIRLIGEARTAPAELRQFVSELEQVPARLAAR